MTQFQILEEIYGIIVQIPKSAMDKIVSPHEESALFFYRNTGNETKRLCNVLFQFSKSSQNAF